MLTLFYLLSFFITYSDCNNYNIFNDIEWDSHKCSNRIHKQCLHSYEFSEDEIENARVYLQNKFYVTDVVRPACKRLHVRKDIKCLTNDEIWDLIYVFKQLYKNGVMDKFSLIHNTFWSAEHKFFEGLTWHRWHVNELEKEMRKINPKVTMPYWEYISEFAAPEKSVIWDVFGHAGNEENGHCIPDGPFAYQKIKYPRVDCVKRQWNTNQTIPVWEPPEWLTSLTQVSQTWGEFSIFIAFMAHFKPHLAIGGFKGDFSTPFATNDPIFYLFHSHVADYAVLKWQLSDDKNLVPNTYDEGFRFDWQTHRLYTANIENDFLNFYNNITVKESFQVGFGELCYIHDQLIKPINDIMKNTTPELPIAVQRLKDALPPNLFATYYPKFASNTSTAFDFILPDVGNCPHDYKCKAIPITTPFNSTTNGRRLLETLRYRANLDITPLVFEAEKFYYRFMTDLQTNAYCSPYV